MQKKVIIALLAVFFTAAGVTLFNSSAETKDTAAEPTAAPEQASPGEPVADGRYELDAESTVAWEGRKPLILGYKDQGTLAIKSGYVRFEGDKVTEGEIVFDMQGIKVASTGKKMGEPMLEKHLKSKDWFEVETHPEAKFVIKEASPREGSEAERGYTVRGDLTIKGITQEIEFPAIIYAEGGKARAVASTELDRTRWDIRYASGKFFGDLGDKIIDDHFGVSFDLTGSMVQ